MSPPAIFHLLPNDERAEHVQRAAQGAPIVKTCSAANTPLIHSLGAKHWLRPYLWADDGLGVDPSQWAHDVATSIKASGQWPMCLTPRNEVAAVDFVGVWYARFRLAMEREGCPPSTVLLLPSFPQGTPDGPAIRAIFHACQAEDPQGRPPAGADFHEYADLSIPGSSPWHTLRCKMLLDEGWIPRGTPVYIGEMLIDAVSRGGSGPDANHPLEDPQGRSGWDDRGKMTAADVAAQLNLYLAQLPPEVVCAAWFADGETPGGRWWNYRSWDTEIETAIRRTWQAAVPSPPTPPIPTPAPPKEPLLQKVLDTSDVQHPIIGHAPNGSPIYQAIDWARAKADLVVGGIVKVTEGTGYFNPTYAMDMQGLRAQGMLAWAYVFGRPDVGNRGSDEARYALQRVGPLLPGQTIALDLERGGGDLSAYARDFFSVMDQAIGRPAPLYVNRSFITSNGLTMAKVGPRPLWLAAPDLTAFPATFADWPVTLWQVAAGTVAGVPDAVDINWTPMSLGELTALGKPGGTTMDQEAQAYYFSAGHKVNTTFALWKAQLEPLYAYWRQLVAQGHPLADDVAPGALVGDETGTTWGNGRPASVVKTQNAVLGVYEDQQGVWRPYRASLP